MNDKLDNVHANANSQTNFYAIRNTCQRTVILHTCGNQANERANERMREPSEMLAPYYAAQYSSAPHRAAPYRSSSAPLLALDVLLACFHHLQRAPMLWHDGFNRGVEMREHLMRSRSHDHRKRVAFDCDPTACSRSWQSARAPCLQGCFMHLGVARATCASYAAAAPQKYICAAPSTKATFSRDAYDVNAGVAVARAAKCFCKLHSA